MSRINPDGGRGSRRVIAGSRLVDHTEIVLSWGVGFVMPADAVGISQVVSAQG